MEKLQQRRKTTEKQIHNDDRGNLGDMSGRRQERDRAEDAARGPRHQSGLGDDFHMNSDRYEGRKDEDNEDFDKDVDMRQRQYTSVNDIMPARNNQRDREARPDGLERKTQI